MTPALVVASALALSPSAQAANEATVTNVQPNVGAPTGGTVVAITGAGLAGATAVRFGSSEARFTVNSPTAIRAVAPAGTGTVDVAVTARGATSATSSADRFSYRQGTAMAWGLNSIGQLGNGSGGNGSGSPESLVPAFVAGLPRATSVAAGGSHALALLGDGKVIAWGDNESGQLGDGFGENLERCELEACSQGPEICRGEEGCSRVPVEVTGLDGVTAIAAGGIHSLALLGDGRVMSWGTTAAIEIGENATLVPTEVPGLRDVVAIAASDRDSLALLKNGKVMAWGNNTSGQLGDGSSASSTVPVEVQGLREVTSIAEGTEFGLALQRNGTVKAWGSGVFGELGNGTTHGSLVPEEVPALTDITAIAAGEGHALALRSDGTLMAWGLNESGQLGDRTASGPDTCFLGEPCSKSPVAVPGLNEVTAISAGYLHSLALLRTGTIEAWGDDLFGELGLGNTFVPERCLRFFGIRFPHPCSTAPVEVKEAREAIAISGGFGFSVASGAL